MKLVSKCCDKNEMCVCWWGETIACLSTNLEMVLAFINIEFENWSWHTAPVSCRNSMLLGKYRLNDMLRHIAIHVLVWHHCAASTGPPGSAVGGDMEILWIRSADKWSYNKSESGAEMLGAGRRQTLTSSNHDTFGKYLWYYISRRMQGVQGLWASNEGAL